MARNINRLSPRSLSSKTERGRYADGGGLYLQVSKSGAKSWLFRFMLNGKSRQMGLGSLHTISLPEAREEALLCRKQLRDGVDPIEARKLKLGKAQADSARVMTFKECAEKYISSHSAGWKNAKHGSQWQNTLKTYVYPVFGDLPVQSIDTGLVAKVIEPIWATKTETASRIRGRIESVLDWATARKYRNGENPARWKGHLDNLFPKRAKVQKVKHHAALPYHEIGAFMATLRQHDAVSARGLEFLILNAARTGEVIGATWDEIDFDNELYQQASERAQRGIELAAFLDEIGRPVQPYTFSGDDLSTALADRVEVKGSSGDRSEVYELPDKKSGVVAKVPGGLEFTILEKEGDFYKIQLRGTKTGYVHKSDVK